MKNEYEYYAIAHELFCYDRDAALKVYSKPELRWLARHTHCGRRSERQ
ncbi:MAG: hypothetical protein AB1540_13115 [Bdellovibrionota bacterium]